MTIRNEQNGSGPSSDGFTELARKYKATVANSYLRHMGAKNAPFNPLSNNTYLIGNVRLGPNKRLGRSIYVPAAGILDNDGVLTAQYFDKDDDKYLYKTLAVSWLTSLSEYVSSKAFKIIEDAITDVMKALLNPKPDYYTDMNKMAGQLNDAKLTREMFRKSIPMGVKKTTIAPGALETVYKMRNVLGIEPAQCSGSPQELLEELGLKRLGISPAMSEGTRFVWNKRGDRIVKVFSNAGYHKLYSRDILLSRMGCPSDLVVYLTDTMEGSDRPIALNAGLGFVGYLTNSAGGMLRWAKNFLGGKKPKYKFGDDFKEFEGKTVIASDAFAEDLTLMLPAMGMWVRSKIMTVLYENPKVYLGVIETGREVKRLADDIVAARGQRFYRIRDEYMEAANGLCADPVVKFITYPHTSNGFDSAFSELEELVALGDRDIETQKSLIVDSFNQLEEGLLEPNFTDTDVKDIKKIVEEWHDRFPDREWINHGI